MVKTVTPFSTRAKEGATDSPLGDFVDVPQVITSTASAGFFDENGKLTGNTSTDRQWKGFTKHESIPNGQTVLVPANNDEDHINMTGFTKIFIAIKPTRGGNCAITAVMGPDTNTFLGLEPLDAASTLQGSNPSATGNAFSDLFNDSAQSLTADVWNIFIIGGNNTTGELAEQKNLQFKIVNNAGGDSTLDFAYLRCA